MFCQALRRIEAELFRNLNQIIEPLVKAGLGSPGPWPTGLVVIETRGRKTGRTISVPLVATAVGDLLLLSTVRGNSQWVENLAHAPGVRYWMHGRPHEAVAVVVAPGQPEPVPADLSPLAAWLVGHLLPLSRGLGIAFAILSPGRLARPA